MHTYAQSCISKVRMATPVTSMIALAGLVAVIAWPGAQLEREDGDQPDNFPGGRPEAEQTPLAQRTPMFVNHAGDALCDSEDIPPISRFQVQYINTAGSVFHGWLPPVGPPFYVCCGGQCVALSSVP